ncbi:MAG: PAS domain-containing hybrid sensor histidine kinase/response regulator, partial [Luteitalea sp.]
VYRWVLDVGTPAVDARGELTGYVGSCLDITEQRDAAAALAASEQHFRMLADHAPVMIWQTDPSGACTFLNQRWYLFTGQTPEQGLGFGWLDAVHPDQREAAAATFKNATDDAGTSQMEYRLRHHSGEYFWAIDSATPHYDGDGVFRGYIGSVTDISDRKAVEEQRERLLLAEREARHEAERTNLIKDEFLAGLSHELRTPLNAILGWAHVLHGNDGLSDETRHGLAIIERNARLQTRLIEDLLDMSRILSGKLRLDVQQVHIATVVEAAVETIRPSAEARGLRLVTVLDPHAGPVAGDPMRLQQVVWNLLSNAVKFTERGGKIEVVLERVNSHLEVSVTDTGVGIRPDFLPHVFERFRQADGSITRSYGGLGIGLSIVKHLVELHGGSVRAKSPGEHRGATFIVALPVLALRQHDDDRGGQHPESPGATRREPDATALAGVSVLVVEDGDDSRALMAAILTACGATVTQAASAAAALEALEPNPPDVLISDIGLPGRDGYELLRTLRRSEGAARSVPALALTAYARSEDRRQALLAGFQLHMAKPVEPDELCTAVASLARRL